MIRVALSNDRTALARHGKPTPSGTAPRRRLRTMLPPQGLRIRRPGRWRQTDGGTRCSRLPLWGARTAQTQALARRTCAKRTCAPSAVTASHAAADGNRPVSRAFLRFFPLPSCRGSARLFPSAARFAAGAPSGPWTWKPALPACRFAAGRPAGRARR